MKTNGIDISINRKWSLKEILTVLDEGQLFWGLAHLWLIPKGAIAQSLEDRVLTGESVAPLSLIELYQAEKDSSQIIEMILIGAQSADILQRFALEPIMYAEADFILNIIDGGFLRITAKDVHILQVLAAHFTEATWLPCDYIKKALLYLIRNKNETMIDLRKDLSFQTVVAWAECRSWNPQAVSALCLEPQSTFEPSSWMLSFFINRVSPWMKSHPEAELLQNIDSKAQELTALLLA